MKATREAVAERFDEVAAELERALAHCRVAASHFRADEVPRGCAHALALQGHLRRSQRGVDEIAEAHASRAGVGDGPPTDEAR